MTNQEELSRIFQPSDDKWLLIIGSNWAASSGVPLPHHRTLWSPSIADLVRYELFRSVSKETFASIERGLQSDKPPLGFISDSLDKQSEWLAQHLVGLKPQKAAYGLADLARTGLFASVITSAPDRLLEDALGMFQIPHATYELGQKQREEGVLPILREWDDRIFQDTEDRRAREANFVDMCLNQILQQTQGILIVGHHPYPCDLMTRLRRRLPDAPPQKIVWVREKAMEANDTELLQSELSPPAWLAANHDDFTCLIPETLGDFVDEVCAIRDVQPSPLPEKGAEVTGITTLLNKTFDIRPALGYVPGVALFSGLLHRMPEISIRAALSVMALLALLIGSFNYYTYREYNKREQPLRKRLDIANKEFHKKKLSEQSLLQLEAEVAEIVRGINTFPLPSYGPMTLPILPTYCKRRRDALRHQAHKLLQEKLIPQLYNRRLAVWLRGRPQMQSMGHYNTLLVRETKRGVVRAHSASGKARLPRPLRNFDRRSRLILFYKSAPFLRVAMYKEMARETKAGQLAISIDLAKTPQMTIRERIQRNILRIVNVRTDYKNIFALPVIDQLLRQGKVSLYFTTFDTSRSSSQAFTRIQAFLSSFPKCRTIIAVSRQSTRKQLLKSSSNFDLLAISDYPHYHSGAYLRKHTSYRYVQQVHDNTYLRWNWKDPLIRSLLIDTYHKVGIAPRSIGVLYERLLQTMLSRGKHNFALKSQLVSLLAYESARRDRPINKERAILLFARAIGGANTTNHIGKAANILAEIERNGVLFDHAKDGITFSDKRFMYIALSKYLVHQSLPRKKHLLLRMPLEIMAFYAGMSDTLDELVSSWMADYLAVDRTYRSKGLHMTFANPYLYNLAYAALAMMNGKVSYRYVQQLESILIEQIGHKLLPVQAKIAEIATHLPTPRIQEWVRESVKRNAPYDHRMLSIIAATPNPVYATPVKLWLERVATPADPVMRWTWRTKKLPQGKRRLHLYHKWAIGHALITLATLGTADALRIVAGFARREYDKRFHPKDWNYFRYYATNALVRFQHFKLLHSLYPAFEKNPKIWCFNADKRYYSLFHSLGSLNDKPTAAFLARLLVKPEPLSVAVGRYKNDAAQALARMDDEIVYPLLFPMLQKAPTSGPDFRVYPALVLGYKRKMDKFSLVKDVALAQLKWRPTSPDKQGVEYHSIMMIVTLAAFRTKAAFALVKKLYLDENWRKHSPARLIDGLNFFRFPENIRFLQQQIHCATNSPADKARMLRVFGMIKKSNTYAVLNRNLEMLEKGIDPLYINELCGNTKPPRWSPAHREALTISAIQTLAMFRQNNDIARLTEWTRHDNPKIQAAAMQALSQFRSQQASDALTRSYQANPKLKWQYLNALHQQRFPYNADKLVSMLQVATGLQEQKYLLYYLRSAGNAAALRAVFPFQYKPNYALAANARWAVYYIAMQLRGKIKDAEILQQLIDNTPAARPKKKSTTSRKKLKGAPNVRRHNLPRRTPRR